MDWVLPFPKALDSISYRTCFWHSISDLLDPLPLSLWRINSGLHLVAAVEAAAGYVIPCHGWGWHYFTRYLLRAASGSLLGGRHAPPSPIDFSKIRNDQDGTYAAYFASKRLSLNRVSLPGVDPKCQKRRNDQRGDDYISTVAGLASGHRLSWQDTFSYHLPPTTNLT